MTGTSLDGVDGVLAKFPAEGPPEVIAHAYQPFSDALKETLLQLNKSGPDELHRAALAAQALTELYTRVIRTLLADAGTTASAVRAIGSHGQTVRHRPDLGYSWQINQPALLAERCGIAVVADFRSRDIAAGGEGAPLVPAFHRALFGHHARAPLAVLNLGGISNLTVLSQDDATTGFDCGPANVLLDHWCHQHTGQAYDSGGAWAASGTIQPRLLTSFLQEPFFALPPPKSTGRDLFNTEWLQQQLQRHTQTKFRNEDVQATLCELTAVTCATALQAHATASRELVVCGGGALNAHLMGRLAHHLPGTTVRTSDELGVPAQHVEAAAFAWLAYRHVTGQPGNLSSVTGAAGPRILGALYPA